MPHLLTGIALSIGAGCATRQPVADRETQSDLVDVSLNTFTGRNSFQPIQRRNQAQALSARKY